MKLPRITIEYCEEESYALGRLSFPLIMGFGIHWAWIYLFMFGGSSLFYPQVGDAHAVLFPVSATFFAATLLCYGVFLSFARRLFSTPARRNANRLVAAMLVFLSMVLMLAANYLPGLAVPCSVVAGVASGIGSAVLLMSYGVSFSVCDLATTAISVAASFLISVVVFVAVMALDVAVPVMGVLLCLLFPLLEAWCLRACSIQLVDRLAFNGMTIPVDRRRFSLHVIAPALVFGFILSILRIRATALVVGGNLESVPSVFMAGLFASALIVMAMLTQREANNFAFRTLCPIVALLLGSLAIPGADAGAWAAFALFSSYIMLEACMWIMCSDISQHFRISAFTVFGFGRGALAVGSVAAYALSVSGGPLGQAVFSTDLLVATALVTITFGVALLPHNMELRRTLKRGSQCPAFASSNDPGVGLASDASRGGLTSVPSPVWIDEPTEENQADLQARAASVEPMLDGALGEGVRDAADGCAIERSCESDARTAGRFKLKCSNVAERYLLSRKETEVLFLLAKGHNSAYIQKALYISAGTANTHMRHIYRKLDVHSQQELMEMVEVEWID